MTHSPETANGYPIIASSPTPGDYMTRAGHVILVDRIDQPFDPYVTAWLADGDTSWCWGHYFAGSYEARRDFDARVTRGY